MSEAESYIAKWLAREPEMELAQVFCAARERSLFALWGALQNELDETMFELSAPSVTQAKLGWWGEELARGAQGAARHPLVREFFTQGSARAIDPAHWMRLAHAAFGVALDERTPPDTAASLERYRTYSSALATIESTLFGVEAPAAALALHQLLRQWPQGEGPSTLRWPLHLLARHQVGAGEILTTSGAALRRDYAAELVALNPEQPRGALFRRCRSALDGWRLRQLAAGRSAAHATGRWRALWLLWRAARSGPAHVPPPEGTYPAVKFVSPRVRASEVAVSEFPYSPLSASMPDVVSHERPALIGALDWVGMDGIALPLLVEDGDGVVHRSAAKVSAWVNLMRAEDRGIHMSRLYRALDRHLAGRAPDATQLSALLQDFLDSHAGQSDRARVRLRFDLSARRPSLRSGLQGWRAYPVDLAAELDRDGFRIETAVQVEYASTCPGSAALARQLIQQQFERDFPAGDPPRAALHTWLGSAQGICATPHAQRSLATVKVRLAPNATIGALALIDQVEAALGTPLQAAVKREDEQEFARLNGANPMYCEDAARRIRAALESIAEIEDYAIHAAHLESLHPHDAVAMAVRGVPGGYVAIPD